MAVHARSSQKWQLRLLLLQSQFDFEFRYVKLWLRTHTGAVPPAAAQALVIRTSILNIQKTLQRSLAAFPNAGTFGNTLAHKRAAGS